MKAARRQIISELIQTQPFISLRELERRFPDVTAMTLRRDIEYFEKQGEIIKVRGGARSMKFISENQGRAPTEKENEKAELSNLMAEKASGFIHKGQSCFIDTGPEGVYLAKALPDEYITVVTTSPGAALELAKKRQPEIILAGGRLSRENLSLSGKAALECIDETDIDVAFMSADGYSTISGFSSKSAPESEIKSLVMNKARKIVMLMDSSKIDRSLPFPFGKLSRVDVLITDKKIPASFIHAAAYPSLKILVCAKAEKAKSHATKCLTAPELELLQKNKSDI